MEENQPHLEQNKERHWSYSYSSSSDASSSIMRLITRTRLERPQPLWLVHHRYRTMDRRGRTERIAREAAERRQLLAERQSMMWGSTRDGFQGFLDAEGNLADESLFAEEMDIDSESGTGSDEIGAEMELEDMEFMLEFPGRGPIISAVPMIPAQELSTLLKFYKNLEAYQKFPVHTFSTEPVLVDPENEIIQSIMKEMECPVCTSTCFPPINTCINNHLVCVDCKIRIFDQPKHLPQLLGVVSPTCPTCRDPGGMEYVLSGALVKAMSVIEFKCLYHEDGCTNILSGLNYLKHVQEECTYRRWKCPFCVELLNLATAPFHFMEAHERSNLGYARWLPSRIADKSLHTLAKFEVPMRGEEIETCYALLHVTTFEKTFLLFQIRTGVLEFAWFVCLFGTVAESRNYRVDVYLQSDYDMGYGVPHDIHHRDWKDIQVFSCQDEMRKIIENVGLTYSDAQMPFNNFCYPGGRAERCTGRMEVNFKKLS